jgi:hypothetical protein
LVTRFLGFALRLLWGRLSHVTPEIPTRGVRSLRTGDAKQLRGFRVPGQ